MKSQHQLLVAVAALAAVLTANLAAAATPGSEDVKARVVRYSDLDLSRPQDVQRLYARIERAAQAVCDNFTVVGLQGLATRNRCLNQAKSDALAQVRATQPQQKLDGQLGK